MRTKRIRPFWWLIRVGFSQVLKECRFTFFSRAPRMRVHGSMMVELVGTKDMRFLRLACRARKDDRQMRKKQQRASSAGDAVGAGSACGLLRWLLYQNRVTRGGTSSSDAVFDPGLGVTPENSVVNGADTSTHASVAWVALSAKKYLAPLLVKTCGLNSELNSQMRRFCGELTTKTSIRDSNCVA
jgi:hypothetical protein